MKSDNLIEENESVLKKLKNLQKKIIDSQDMIGKEFQDILFKHSLDLYDN